MAKFLIVSNRLPVTVKPGDDGFTYSKSIGGLATGLKNYHEQNDALWVGWPGVAKEILSDSDQTSIAQTLEEDYKARPVFLSQEDIELYYEGFSNKTIWPLFHYFAEKTEHTIPMWEAYQAVNQRFLEALEPFIEPDSTIWVHDYQLMLLPGLIRDKYPSVKIGFFLHIPFPSFEIFRLLIWQKEILLGLLGSDLIGFHTYDYVRHFLSSIRRILGLDHHLYQIKHEDRLIETDAFPMGIHYDFFAESPVAPYEKKVDHLILSVDRLDYTKGILERLESFRVFLDKYPDYHTKVSFYLIVAPSRTGLETYESLKESIEKTVSEINGAFGSFDWMPVWFLYQSFTQEDLISFYKAADLMLVTPLRDGMNLVAKEYLAAQKNHHGMLILSETAGAASELSEALIVNPNDHDGVADEIKLAFEMSLDEKRSRHKIMQKRLKRYNVTFWADTFMKRLTAIEPAVKTLKQEEVLDLEFVDETFKAAKRKILFLDYDGTLMSFKKHPDQAYPSVRLKKRLTTLAEIPGTDVVVISGRDHQTLENWLGMLPVSLVGDHGLFIKKKNTEWKKMITPSDSWMVSLRNVLETYADQMPGAFIEDKTHSLAFHFRNAEPDMLSVKIPDLKETLRTMIGAEPIEIQEGHRVIEIKDQRINKGQATYQFTNEITYDFVLTIGDDTTDEDMFKAQADGVTIKVGFGDTAATKRVRSTKDVSALLERLENSAD